MSSNESYEALSELFAEIVFKRGPINLKGFIISFEKMLIFNALSSVRGNQIEAARLLGVKYTTLNAKIKRYGIGFQTVLSAPETSSLERQQE